MIRFLIIFVMVLILLFVGELTSPVQQWIVVPWTSLLANIGALLLQVLDTNVISQGKVLQNASTGAGVSIEAGCNGVEACLILVAALAAYPARWLAKLMGIVVGFAAIQALNLVRIITLFYLAGWNSSVFEFAHLYLWQALIMLDVLIVWLVWMRWVARQDFRQSQQNSLLVNP